MEHILLPALDWNTGRVSTHEMLEVEHSGDSRVRLLHSPAFVDGIARGDLLELLPQEVEGFRVLERGGYLAIVVAFPTAEVKATAGASDLRTTIEALGGVYEGGPGNAGVYSVPVKAGFPKVETAFEHFCQRHTGATWWFGNVYSRSGEALGWWS